MKKISLMLLLVAAFTLSKAQPNRVTSCFNYLRYGEIENAKAAIDPTISHEKTMNKAKTWLYYAQTYHAINDSCMYKKSQKYCDLASDALTKAYEAYMKAWVLNFADPVNKNLNIKDTVDFIKFSVLLSKQETKYEDDEIMQKTIFGVSALTNSFVNKGLSDYNDKNYPVSLQNFETAVFLSQLKSMVDAALGNKFSLDTIVIFYAGLAAEKANNYKTAIQYYDQLTKLKFGNGPGNKPKAAIYLNLAILHKTKGDTVKYISTLKKGIEKYPNDGIDLMNNLINYYLLDKKDTKTALDYLNIAIEKDPTNPNYYTVKGSIYDKMNNLTESETAYNKAIELDPKNVDALINLGVLYFNKAGEINNKANEQKDNAKFEAMIKQRDDIFKKALPFLEKAHELAPDDASTMESLKTIYYRLKMMEKSEAMKAKLDATKNKKK